MTLQEVSWLVDEPTYRADPALSYSNISTYESLGFSGLDHLFDRKETPSLTFGSMVDTYITDGPEAYENRYLVADIPVLSDQMNEILTNLLILCGSRWQRFEDIPKDEVVNACTMAKYGMTWRADTRYSKVVDAKVGDIYDIKASLTDKELVSTEMHNDCMATVNALKTSDATKWYFQANNSFDEWERFYQLKFKATLNGIDYRCMADLLMVNKSIRKIIPCDLKTGSVPEWEFPNNFIKWHYQLQARSYPRVIKEALKGTEYEGYTWENYRFIYVNKKTLTPLVWTFPYTYNKGRLIVADNIFEDPEVLGAELYNYLQNKPAVPTDIKLTQPNDIAAWLSRHCKK